MNAVLRPLRELPVVAIRRPEELFPTHWFSVEVSAGGGDASSLHPSEQRLIDRAVPKRRAEFAAGRVCAHRALDRLQHTHEPLLRDPHGCPVWPSGALGSISHTRGCVVSVVARKPQVAAVGVDVDDWREPFTDLALAHICRSEEKAWLEAMLPTARNLHAYALFSIKEAIYKCVYVGTGERLGFHDASVHFDLQQGLFSAQLQRPLPGGRQRLIGRVGCNQNHVFSGLWWFGSRTNHEEESHAR